MNDLRLEIAAPYLLIVLEYFEKKCTNQVDIFNTQGNQAKISVLINKIRNFTLLKQFQQEIESGFYSQYDLAWGIHSILCQLSHPLILENYNEAYIVNTYYEDIEKIKTCILELPEVNIQIVLKLFSVFKKLCTQELHKSFIILSPEVLGEMFSNVLMRFKKERDEVQQFGNKIFATNVISCLIINYNEIFDSTIMEFEHKEQIQILFINSA
ncbi:hypothetical protein DICPUDRAFT_96526 [Dictyostelium purpureum]|uniref:Rho-GAP domain-containing protein n=1 Tax=Dictyostelium purpureum TaxID=5786 RepID=F0Z924_DICPU|nr:uncharacterized protein DICPUDRAFT_96526 [Dictyostelium purpureum]EGC39590.1 hypothetical protein DICPUDRAFT_96526 [Dictyostelium purpureum]|eukprot:XP_003283925.1 hypothetical protein DICPUDRAFT_96526 [Dictyostelium purpureum]